LLSGVVATGTMQQSLHMPAIAVALALFQEHEGNPKVELYICELLARLTCSIEDYQLKKDSHRDIIVNALESVFSFWLAQRTGSSERRRVEEALGASAERHPVEVSRAVDRFGPVHSPAAWVVVMRASKASIPVQRCACEAFSHLTDVGPCAKAIEAGALDAICEAMRRHEKDPGLQRASCEALEALLLGSATSPCETRSRGAARTLQVVASSLRGHRVYPWVCTAALHAASALVATCPEIRPLAVREDLWSLVAAAMRSHPQSRVVQKAAGAVLAQLDTAECAGQADTCRVATTPRRIGRKIVAAGA